MLINGIRDLVDALLTEKEDHIAQALTLTEDGKVAIGIMVKIEEAEPGLQAVKVSFRLVKERVKGEKGWICDTRSNLPGMDKDEAQHAD